MDEPSALLLAPMLAPMLVSTMLITIDATSIIFALPTITEDLHGSATESFWISASFLLAMCISQPIVSNLSTCVKRKSLILSSFLIWGLGSITVDYAAGIVFCLVGRSVQGLGAGGLLVLTYVAYGDLKKHNIADKYLRAITCSAAVGTISGPFIGASLSHKSSWRWIFRLDALICLLLGAIVYNSSEIIGELPSQGATFLDTDYLGAALFIGSVVPLLVGLSLAGGLYEWTDWRVLSAIALGSVISLLFIGRELFPSSPWLPGNRTKASPKPLLRLKSLYTKHTVVTFTGAIILGFMMFALLFFVPIYFGVVKQHSQLLTAILLLPQTCMILPCAFIVLGLIEKEFSPACIILSGWLCTSCGFGLLTALGTETTVFFDVMLNVPSGFGIGILLPTLAISAKGCANALDAQTLLVSLRYLGSALSLVILGIIFQQVLRYNLTSTKFEAEASEMTKYVTVLMSSIPKMANSGDKNVLIRATDKTLRIIWIVLSAICFVLFLLSCTMAVITKHHGKVQSEPSDEDLEKI